MPRLSGRNWQTCMVKPSCFTEILACSCMIASTKWICRSGRSRSGRDLRKAPVSSPFCRPGPLPVKHLRSIYREILSSSRALQRQEKTAYLGPEGTFTHAAARNLLGASAALEPYESLEAVFAAVDSGQCAYGLVPLENSLHGSVVQTFDLFLRYNLFIVAETGRRVRHSLLSRETELSAVSVVVSHPQALAQCAAS